MLVATPARRFVDCRLMPLPPSIRAAAADAAACFDARFYVITFHFDTMLMSPGFAAAMLSPLRVAAATPRFFA